MANDLNRVVIIGRLTRDPELKFTPNGAAICSVAMATNKSYKVNDIQKDEVSYFDVTIFGKFGEMVAQYYKKGQRVAVDGKLQQQRWETDGQKKSKIVIIADSFQGLTFNEDNQGSKPQQQQTPQQSTPKVDNNPFSDQDIPF